MMGTERPINPGEMSRASAHGLWSLGLLGWTFIGSAVAHAGLLVVLSQTPVQSSLVTPAELEFRRGDHAMQVTLTTRRVAVPEASAELPLDDSVTSSLHEALDVARALSEQITAVVEVVASPRRRQDPDAERLLNPLAHEAQPPTDSRIAPRKPAAHSSDLARPPAPLVDMPLSDAEEQLDQPESSDESTAGVPTGAQVVNLPVPKYPPVSRRRGEEGLVVLRVQVRTDGSVGRIVVIKDGGHRRLRDAAIDAVRQARFRPALRDGRGVFSEVIVPIRFRLGESDCES